MQIPRRYYLALILLIVSGLMIAWGASQLSVSNTATVTLASKNFALDIIATSSSCPAYASNSYSSTNASLGLAWPSIAEPGSASFLFCLENVGTATSATFTQGTVTPSPSPGAVSLSPAGPVTITPQGVTSITTTLTATIGTPPSTYLFTLTIA